MVKTESGLVTSKVFREILLIFGDNYPNSAPVAQLARASAYEQSPEVNITRKENSHQAASGPIADTCAQEKPGTKPGHSESKDSYSGFLTPHPTK